jgi:hypothetical protein
MLRALPMDYFGRYRGKSGHTVGVPKPTLMTQNGHHLGRDVTDIRAIATVS